MKFEWTLKLILQADREKDRALSYCLTQMAYSSVMVYRGERLCLYFLWENGYCLCHSCVLIKPCTIKNTSSNIVGCNVSVYSAYSFLSVWFWENIIIRCILSYRLFLYKASSLYACISLNNYVTTEHFVMVHVCQHFCRALFPITSISICRITNKCKCI